jgi:hypothetical protein
MSAVYAYASSSMPTGASVTLAWDFEGATTFGDGGKLIYAFYKGVDTTDPVRGTNASTAASSAVSTVTVTTPSLTASSGDMIFTSVYAYDTVLPSGMTYTNTTDVHTGTYNSGVQSAAEAFPSGNVALTVDPTGNSGDDLWLAVASVVFRATTEPAPPVYSAWLKA